MLRLELHFSHSRHHPIHEEPQMYRVTTGSLTPSILVDGCIGLGKWLLGKLRSYFCLVVLHLESGETVARYLKTLSSWKWITKVFLSLAATAVIHQPYFVCTHCGGCFLTLVVDMVLAGLLLPLPWRTCRAGWNPWPVWPKQLWAGACQFVWGNRAFLLSPWCSVLFAQLQ